jgi:hypothetical protein
MGRAGLFAFVARKAEGDSAPEEARAHLYGQMALVVGVPNPDVPAILDDTGIGRGLHADGLEGAEGGLDFLAALHFHGHRDGVQRVHNGNDKALANFHGLRRGVVNAGQQIRKAARDGGLNVLGLACDLVFLVEDGLALPVIHSQGGVDLAAAFDRLLVELVGAAFVAVKCGLETVAYVKQQIDGANGVRIGGDAFAVAGRLKVQDRSASGENPPVDCVDERLLLGKAETCPGRRQGARLLGSGTRGQGKNRACNCCG